MEQLTDVFDWATGLIDSLSQLVTDSPVTYLFIFVMAALDVLFPILPAEGTVTAAAVLAGQARLSVAWVMVAAAVGAFVGDNVAYWVGRAAGRPLVERVLRGNTAQLRAVQEQFDARGGLFIIFGRFVPGGRTAVAIGAGALRFSWPRFLAYDAAAAVAWAIDASLPGYIGGSLVQDRPWLALVIGFGLSAVLAGAIALFQRRRSRVAAKEARLKPAVLGFGGVDAAVETHAQAVAELAAEASGPGGTAGRGSGDVPRER